MTTAARPEEQTSTASASAESAPISTSGEPLPNDMGAMFDDAPQAADPFSDKPTNDPFDGAEQDTATESAAPTPEAAPAPTPEPELTPIPFKFQVDGREMPFEGIEEIPGEGLIVTADAVPKVRDAFQRAERLGSQVQQYEQALTRFQKVGGFERMAQLEANSAVLQAVGEKFLQLLADDKNLTPDGFPQGLAELATDPRARALMLRELDVLTRDAELRARGQFTQSLQSVEQAGQEQMARGNAIQGAVGEMASAIQRAYGVQLAPEDLAEAQEVFSQFADQIYRPATPQEAASLRIPVGSPIIDYPKMHPWFTARAQIRQRDLATASKTTAAASENAQRLAAATPTRPVSNRAVTQRPGNGQKQNPRNNPNRPDIKDWRTRMKMGLSPVPDADTNP